MKIRVLVVEDEPPIQRSICQKIEESNENFKVIFQGKTCKFIVASQEIYREMAVICCSQKILYPFMKKLQV